MKKLNTIYLLSGIIIALTISLYLGSCENPIEQSDDSDTAVVTGRVFMNNQKDLPVGKGEVRAQIQGDSQSDFPYEGPLVYSYTDANGVYEVCIPLGSYNRSTGTGNETADFRARYTAGVDLLLIYNQKTWKYEGLTVSRGRKYYIPDVSIESFSSGSEGNE